MNVKKVEGQNDLVHFHSNFQLQCQNHFYRVHYNHRCIFPPKVKSFVLIVILRCVCTCKYIEYFKFRRKKNTAKLILRHTHTHSKRCVWWCSNRNQSRKPKIRILSLLILKSWFCVFVFNKKPIELFFPRSLLKRFWW